VSEHTTNKYTQYFLIAFGIAVVVILVVLFGFKGEEPAENILEYNYFTFREVAGMWEANIQLDNQLYNAVFRFNPEQVEDVDIVGNFTGFRTSPIYITFDPDAEEEEFKYLALATSELSIHLIRALEFEVEPACTKNETDACLGAAIVTCDDVNKSVIYLVPKPPTQMTLEDNCVTLQGHELDLLKAVDRLLYRWYKVQ